MSAWLCPVLRGIHEVVVATLEMRVLLPRTCLLLAPAVDFQDTHPVLLSCIIIVPNLFIGGILLLRYVQAHLC